MLPVSQPRQGSSNTVIWHYPGFCTEGLDTTTTTITTTIIIIIINLG
jgi:hypothetical protein